MEGANTEPKHQQIHGSVTRLIKRIDNLERLLNEIDPRPPEQPDKAALMDSPVALGEFLATEAGRLDNASAKLEKLTDELRGILF